MKKYIEYIAILIISLFVFNVQNVGAVNGVNMTSCLIDHTCMAVCGYTHVSNPVKKSNRTAANKSANVTNEITIYYHFSNNQWSVISGHITNNSDGTQVKPITIGPKSYKEVFAKGRVHMKGITSKEDNFSCPKYGYFDLSKNLFNSFEVCFDNDGKACSNYSKDNAATTFGTASPHFISSKKTYSVFSQIKTYANSTKALDVDCTIYSDTSKGYLNSDGSLNKKKVNDYFEKKIETDFLVNLLGGGVDDKGHVKVDNSIPEFVKNHKEYQTLFSESSNASILSKVKTICNSEIQKSCDNGTLNAEQCQKAKNNVNSLTVEDVTTTQEALEAADRKGASIRDMTIDEVDDSCDGILDDEASEFIKELLSYIRYGGVIIALLLSTLDLIKAVSSGSQEDLTKAMKRFGKRMIYAALLFFVALIVEILLGIFGITVAAGCEL